MRAGRQAKGGEGGRKGMGRFLVGLVGEEMIITMVC